MMNLKNKILLVAVWAIQLMAAVILFKAAIAKFAAHPRAVHVFVALGMEPAGRIIIGVLELAAAVLLLIPNSIVYGAFLGLGIMMGAVIGHLTSLGIEGLQMALIVLIGCVMIIYFRRHESSLFKNMFG